MINMLFPLAAMMAFHAGRVLFGYSLDTWDIVGIAILNLTVLPLAGKGVSDRLAARRSAKERDRERSLRSNCVVCLWPVHDGTKRLFRYTRHYDHSKVTETWVVCLACIERANEFKTCDICKGPCLEDSRNYLELRGEYLKPGAGQEYWYASGPTHFITWSGHRVCKDGMVAQANNRDKSGFPKDLFRCDFDFDAKFREFAADVLTLMLPIALFTLSMLALHIWRTHH